MKLIVDNRGDLSVGINGFQIEVEIKNTENFEKEFVSDFIENTKNHLKDWFGQETYCEVYTEEEYEALINIENQLGD